MLAIYNDSNVIKRGLVSNLGETNRTQELVEPDEGRSSYRKYLSYLNSELDEIQTKELSEMKCTPKIGQEF